MVELLQDSDQDKEVDMEVVAGGGIERREVVEEVVEELSLVQHLVVLLKEREVVVVKVGDMLD
jgi:hypothetical protein